MERYEWEPGGWVATVEELSAGVYEIRAISPTLGEVRMTTDDPDAALERCRSEAIRRARPDTDE